MIHRFNQSYICVACGAPAWAVEDGLVTNNCPSNEQALKRVEAITRLRDGELPGDERTEEDKP